MRINYNELSNLNNYILIDVRNRYEYLMGHLKGSINIPYNMLLMDIMKYPKDTKIILYCNFGNLSKKACMTLNKLGYQDVYYIHDINIKDYIV